MPSYTKIAGTGANDASIGSVAWEDPGMVTANDGDYAEIFSPDLDTDISNYLKATNFGFNINSNARIDGIVVTFGDRISISGSDIVDHSVRIVKGGTVGSTDRSEGAVWPNSEQNVSFGSSTDLWGESWTPADINASNFGVVLSVEGTATGAAPAVDYIQITVHFSIPLADVAFYSGHPTDNVIGVYEGSITIPVRTDPENVDTINTGLDNNPFFVGIFTVDSGSERNDVGGRFVFDDGAGFPTLYGVRATAVNGDIKITTKTNDTSTHSCSYKIAAIAQPSQGKVTIPISNDPTILKYLSSEFTYRKIAYDTPVDHTVSSSSTSSKSINHGLGYRPSVLAFIEVSGVMYDATDFNQVIAESGFDSCFVEVRVDDEKLTYFFINDIGSTISAKLYPRIYYDEN